ncbi:MAG TPA: exodeoxyribonuclease V subunit gamma, partial [Burkholderiaceae bacterium]|nr:exodeoxyribonuclease V subunit gamma [Burkholderiaceae bacterium]
MTHTPVSPIEPGLIVLHSNRMEMLRDLLVEWLAGHPLDPLEADIIAVQSNGIAQWLRSTLARGSPGIAAAIETPMPSRLLWSLYRRVLGEENVPPSSPLDEQPLTWRLMRLLGNLQGPVYAPLIRFLAEDRDLRKRYQLAQRLADLFDQYQVYRADWLADWGAGRDQLRGHGATLPLDPDQTWQAALWRDILADVGARAAVAGRAGVHEQFLQTLRAWPAQGGRPDLPRRIVVFGLSALPRQSLEALIEVSRWVQVLVCVHNPCEYHWADIVEGRALLRNVRRLQRRKPGMPADIDEDALHAHAHPLLASWGRQGRDYIALLEELEEECSAAGGAPVALKATPLFVEVEGASVLARLQDDIRALRSLDEARAENRVLADNDDSIQFHIAHSPLREVEILHDRLLAAFDADPSLQPDDVIVMVPDIEKYAPYVDAVFGLHGPEDDRYIPYFIVDRGPGRINTVADAVQTLLMLPAARMGVGE